MRHPPTIVLAPDSFKGSLGASEVCDAIARGIARAWPAALILARPMADGGEGTLDAVLAASGENGRRAEEVVQGASGASHRAAFGEIVREGKRIAVIEAAQVVGLTDAVGTSVDIAARSTVGIGELIVRLLDRGVRDFMVGLGGSSTNDGGAGLLAALGLRLLDANGRAVAPTLAGLATLARADAAGLDPRIAQASITIMSDVTNPLCGSKGATAVFGPQKGVRAGDIATFDAHIGRLAQLVERTLGREASHASGAGAAGGLGFALQILGAKPTSGAEVVADLIGLDEALEDAAWAITGEGRSDAQTLDGKAPSVVAARAARSGVPVTLLSGALDAAALPALNRAFAGCFALADRPMALAECMAEAVELVADRAEAMARLAHAFARHPSA